MTVPTTPIPASIARLEQRALPVAVVGLLLLAVGLATNPAQFFRSYLFAYLFWVGLAVGCLSISMLSHVTGGMWGLFIRRFLEAGTRTFPLLAVLFLPIALGVGRIYNWVTPGDDEVLREKALYLNVPFFMARAAFYFACWMALSHFLSKWSLELDKGENPEVSRRLEGLSAGGLVVMGLTITFSAVDWGMSLAPHWFSTIYGLFFVVGQALSALALAIVCVAWLAEERPIAEALRPGTVHDLGKLMLAFTMLWAYVNLSQFVITWSGNVSEETPYYIHRMEGGWQWVGLTLILFHFALPFMLLLSRDLKRNAKLLGTLAAWMLAARLLDVFYIIAPDAISHGQETVPLSVHWLDLIAPLAIGGAWAYAFARQLRSRPVLPVGEPEVAELLEAAHAEAAR